MPKFPYMGNFLRLRTPQLYIMLNTLIGYAFVRKLIDWFRLILTANNVY